MADKHWTYLSLILQSLFLAHVVFHGNMVLQDMVSKEMANGFISLNHLHQMS